MKCFTSLLLALTFHFAAAQEVGGWTPKWKPVDAVTAKSDDGRVSLKVRIQRFDRDDLRVEKNEDKDVVYAGKERLPVDVLYYHPCLVRGFDLLIDGKKIEVPDRLWKDVGGFGLYELSDLPKNAPEDLKAEYEFHMQNPKRRLQVRYSEKDDNYMIIWERGADCDQTHTLHWIISKDGKMIMRHLEIPPHAC